MYRVLKRPFDLALVVLTLPITGPLFLALAAAVRWTSGRPVLYRGVRAGRGGRPFAMYKFRTMVVNAERVGGTSTADDDPRITRVGRLLRRYKLDELPQLVNVVKGDMSLVGPRPQVLDEVASYNEEERRVLTVKPGITDYASIRFRNEGDILRGYPDPDAAYQRLIRPEKMRLAVEYANRVSFSTDVGVLARTLLAVVGVNPSLPTGAEGNTR